MAQVFETVPLAITRAGGAVMCIVEMPPFGLPSSWREMQATLDDGALSVGVRGRPLLRLTGLDDEDRALLGRCGRFRLLTSRNGAFVDSRGVVVV